MAEVNLFWFRRDLRLYDNAGLYHALKSGKPVVPVFIFDKNILDLLEEKGDSRVTFIHEAVSEIQAVLIEAGSTFDVRYGKPEDVFKSLLETYKVENVFTNHDYEPYATERDAVIQVLLTQSGVGFKTYKDQVIFDRDEITKDDGRPYTVFTP